MLNLTRLHLGIAHESQFQGLGITPYGRWVARVAGVACAAAGAWMLLSSPQS
jgi:hydrogenase/urease accessory protein HupE